MFTIIDSLLTACLYLGFAILYFAPVYLLVNFIIKYIDKKYPDLFEPTKFEKEEK